MKRFRLAALSLPALLLALPAVADEQGSKTGLFNTRYCEILTLNRNGLKAKATVYNTIGFNDCPASAWNGIDKKAATKQLGADGLDMNGPRYWLIDGIKGKGVSATGKTITVNGIEMGERATLDVSLKQALGGRKLYSPNEVKRETVFTFRAGKPVFELKDPEGNVYRMQSYSQIVNKKETLEDLAGLGAKLKLPKGWTYSTRVLDKDYDLLATGLAYVVQDDFQNTYQRLPKP
ncbi:hypothetical protein [Rhizobium sp. C4]|uniref:hypothetical protein n=1 Tax=Rhizobium sp. C4 TaxID=1349800 RepID=UPI001E4BD4FB|nr:hypothetical protein [Rhizobium sp. C4]MCD2173213.1 hypothetical protein [Rhizobium sp. C4]